jgi:hypothetical protein
MDGRLSTGRWRQPGELLQHRHRLLGTPLVNRLLYATKLRPERARTRQQLRAVTAHPERLSEELLDVVHAAAVLPGPQQAWLSMLERVARPGRRVELAYTHGWGACGSPFC